MFVNSLKQSGYYYYYFARGLRFLIAHVPYCEWLYICEIYIINEENVVLGCDGKNKLQYWNWPIPVFCQEVRAQNEGEKLLWKGQVYEKIL